MTQIEARRLDALAQIAMICTEQMDRAQNHRMALDAVRQIAIDAAKSDDSPN